MRHVTREYHNKMRLIHMYEFVARSYVWVHGSSICMSSWLIRVSRVSRVTWLTKSWTRHATLMNESRPYVWVRGSFERFGCLEWHDSQSRERGMPHLWMSHVTHMNESHHAYACVMSVVCCWLWPTRWGSCMYEFVAHSYVWVCGHTQTLWPTLYKSGVSLTHEHSCERGMPHLWMSHVTHMQSRLSDACSLHICSHVSLTRARYTYKGRVVFFYDCVSRLHVPGLHTHVYRTSHVSGLYVLAWLIIDTNIHKWETYKTHAHASLQRVLVTHINTRYTYKHTLHI